MGLLSLSKSISSEEVASIVGSDSVSASVAVKLDILPPETGSARTTDAEDGWESVDVAREAEAEGVEIGTALVTADAVAVTR